MRKVKGNDMNHEIMDKSKGESPFTEAPQFDTTKDYGNEYANVYFRIDAKHYQYPFNTYDGYVKDEKTFTEETKDIFTSLGWDFVPSQRNSTSDEAKCGKQELYLHPQNFSGIILKNSIGRINEKLKNGVTFKLRWTDVYETVYEMTDEEYENILGTRDEEIEQDLLKMFTTKRTNLYYPEVRISELQDKYRIRRLDQNDGRNYGYGQTYKHISGVLQKLTAKGYILKVAKDDTFIYRTLNKTEQKKLKICFA